MSNIASERVRLGLTQQDLADFLGVKRETVGRWENGTIAPKVENIKKMADFFKCSTDYILELSEERIPR